METVSENFDHEQPYGGIVFEKALGVDRAGVNIKVDGGYDGHE